MSTKNILIILLICFAFCSCQQQEKKHSNQSLFKELQAARTGIQFENKLAVNDSMNFFKYGYFYMGGGVAAGDLNGDEQVDLFFTGNMNANALYLNQGNLKFEEVSQAAGIQSSGKWHTGCAMTDLNNDGRLDIYVSVAGIWNDRNNLLYINQGNDEKGIPQFKEVAAEWGLDDAGFSIQTAFLDYDQDGDIDVFVVNYSPVSFNTTVAEYKTLMEQKNWEDSDHLYRNNGDGTFTDVTEEAGVLQFGLGIGVISADFNNDNLSDLYVSNDFHTPDFFYLNNGDGTFTESLKECVQQTSFYGMGIDAGDINNDGLIDLMQVDMTAADNYRAKANMASMNIPAFNAMIDQGFHYQYMYNSLQINNGVRKNGLPFFSNVSKLHDLEMTDWSWACLFGDYDNNGFQDLFITNGSRKDINNKDYFKWLKQTDTKLKVKYKELSFADLTAKMSSQKLDNFIYKNTNGSFEKANTDWGLHFEGYSNGATYADLDQDGDLELIINNIDSTAIVFENLANHSEQHYLKIKLVGPEKNQLGLGAKVFVSLADQTLMREQTLVRGYQSSVDPVLHFGLGEASIIDTLKVIWPDGKSQMWTNTEADQLLTMRYEAAKKTPKIDPTNVQAFFQLVENDPFGFQHQENKFDDYKREILLPHKMSSFGPGIDVADINGDGQEDLFVSGAKGFPSIIYTSKKKRNAGFEFVKTELSNPEQEDIDGVFFDANGNGSLDLLMVSGGNEEDQLSNDFYRQRIYQDIGQRPKYQASWVDQTRLSASVVLTSDLDKNGVSEVFYGGRQAPGEYPKPVDSYLLSRTEANSLTDQNWTNLGASIAPALKDLGMVTDAIWTDYDQDGDEDLWLVGEWMNITIFENNGDKLKKKEIPGISDQLGWWKDICKGDFDQDGDEDYVLSNLGLNYKYKANAGETFDCYANDFDSNEDIDIVLGYYQEGEQYPVRGKQCSSQQIPELGRKFRNYHSFAIASLDEIYQPEQLKNGLHFKANQFGHVYIENLGNGKLKLKSLPKIFQQSSYNCALSIDINEDGHLDIIMAGNIFDSEAETPRSDSEFGTVALGDGQGNFRKLTFQESGLYIPYETQDIDQITIDGNKYLLFANNDAPLLVYQLNTNNKNHQ